MEVTIAENIGSLLIVEDEALVSMMIEDMARDLGVCEVHICADLESARAHAASTDLGCAVLDIRVRGGETAAVADILAERGIPFLFSTGDGPDGLPARHRNRPLIIKPFSEDAFKTTLLDALMSARYGQHAVPQRLATLMSSD